MNRSGCTGLAALVQVEAKVTVLISVSGSAKSCENLLPNLRLTFPFFPEIIPPALVNEAGELILRRPGIY